MSKISAASIVESTAFRPWEVAVAPFELIPGLYYIGNSWVGAYLIDTGDGLILIDTTVSETCYQLIDSIYRLGFNPRDIKLILLSHAHFDHTANASQIQGISGASIYLSHEDEMFRHDPAASYLEGAYKQFKDFPYEVNCFYDDTDQITLGRITINTRLTPGHTPGTTSFFIQFPTNDGTKLTAAMHGGVGINTMTDEAFKKSGLSPSLRDRFIHDCEIMKQIPADICLPSHPTHAPLLELAEQKKADFNPFIDTERWSAFLEQRKSFAMELM